MPCPSVPPRRPPPRSAACEIDRERTDAHRPEREKKELHVVLLRQRAHVDVDAHICQVISSKMLGGASQIVNIIRVKCNGK